MQPTSRTEMKRMKQFRTNFSVDRKKKNENEEDVGMVTAFQETQMLKSEVVLHEAARKNNVDVTKKLLAAKVNVNCTNNLDRTPLQWAAANGHKEVVQVLLEHGADLEAHDKYGMRPLLWAAWFGHVEVVKYLVSYGADSSISNKQGLNLLHCAANQNRLEVINFIIESLEHFNINDVDKKGRSPLHLASNEGSIEAAERLLESQRNCDMLLKDKVGQTPLHLAASNGHVDVVRKLLHTGMEIDDRDEEGRTACHLAAENGHAEVVDLLFLSNADPNAETLKEMTALHIASQDGHELVTRLIIEYGCNVNAQNSQGNTALHLASMSDAAIIIRILIDAGADLDLPNHRLHTPLHTAVEKGHSSAVEELLIAGANIASKEKAGRSALYMASRGSFIGIVDMIIKADREQNADKTPEEPEVPGFTQDKPIRENGGLDVSDNGYSRVGTPASKQELTENSLPASKNNPSVVGSVSLQPGTPIRCMSRSNSPISSTPPIGTPERITHVTGTHSRAVSVTGTPRRTPQPPHDETGFSDIDHLPVNSSAKSNISQSISECRGSIGNFDSEEQLDMGEGESSSGTVTHGTDTNSSTLPNSEMADFGLEGSLEDAELDSAARKQFKTFKHPYAEQMKTVLYKLATKQLKSGDWKKLATHWRFTDEHIRSIMHQYTGDNSHREHGYRMLLIWLYGVKAEDNPMKDLYEGLCAIGRRNLAEQIRKKIEESSSKSACIVC